MFVQHFINLSAVICEVRVNTKTNKKLCGNAENREQYKAQTKVDDFK